MLPKCVEGIEVHVKGDWNVYERESNLVWKGIRSYYMGCDPNQHLQNLISSIRFLSFIFFSGTATFLYCVPSSIATWYYCYFIYTYFSVYCYFVVTSFIHFFPLFVTVYYLFVDILSSIITNLLFYFICLYFYSHYYLYC